MGSRSLVPVSGRGRKRRSAAQWSALVSTFGQSGLSRRAFCARHGVSVSTFDWWRKRLDSEPGGLPMASADSDALFVELSAPLAATRTVPAASVAWDVELDLGSGMVLRLRRGVAC